MRSARLKFLLAGTAVALAMAINPAARADNDGVPMPETAQLPPPSVKDIGPMPEAPAASPAAAPAQAAPAAPAPVTQAAPAPAAVVTVTDNAVSDKLREMSNGKFDRLLGGKKDRTEVEKFYSARQFAPLWVSNGAANERGKAAVAYLGKVDADALDPTDYPTPDFKATDADGLAEAELKLTDAVLNFARHAQIGRVHYTRVGSDIAFNLQADEPSEVLKKIASAGDTRAALDSFTPQHAGYKALKAKLAEIRGGKTVAEPAASTEPPIARGETLKLLKKGVMKDSRVPALRARFDIDGDKASTAYDKAVAAAVTGFQKEKGIAANGQLNNVTVDALNGGAVAKRNNAQQIDAIVATMERWRWLPRNLGNPYVMVNVPDFSLRIEKNDALYWKTRIVAGKPSQATPMTTAEMRFITVNPTWNVPPSIIENEYLPALRQDPQALERIGLKVEQAADGTVRIYQPPGDRNALGRIRFNFPNKFLVYQHDTPDKHLFAHDKRAYSHGCMRVQDPLVYGEKILSLALPEENYTAARLQKMFGGSEININFPKTIPVHLTYQTAFVDDDGKLVIRDDVYGRDAKLLAILRSSERKVADIAIDRPLNFSSKPVKLAPGSLGGNTYGYSGGGNFFDWIFGGPQPQMAPPSRRNSASGRISQR